MGARGHPRIRDSPGERDYFDPIWPRQLSHHQSLIPINLRRSQRTAEAPEKRGWRVVRDMCARHKMTSRRCIHFARSCGEGGGKEEEEDDTRPWGNAFEVDPSLAVIDESFLNHEILIMRVTFASLIFLFPRSIVSTANR